MIETVIFWYYLLHIPITFLIDASVIIPNEYHLNLTRFLVDFHTLQNKDILLLYPQTWFKIFIFIEVVFQFPLFFYFVWKYLCKQLNTRYYLWSLIYGFNASFTTFVCLVYVVCEGKGYGLTQEDIVKLVLIYMPYFIMPLTILIYSFRKLEDKVKLE